VALLLLLTKWISGEAMEKMLGNQYFMARNFKEAFQYLARAHARAPGDIAVLRNLVICEVVVGRLPGALNHLLALLHAAPQVLHEGCLDVDGCPCPDILTQWSIHPPNELSQSAYLLSMGILALFCDRELAKAYLRQAQRLDPGNKALAEAINLVRAGHHENWNDPKRP
jgi:tetratricopeptide (TPR) repeat protein